VQGTAIARASETRSERLVEHRRGGTRTERLVEHGRGEAMAGRLVEHGRGTMTQWAAVGVSQRQGN
jgi:hypothetical protein